MLRLRPSSLLIRYALPFALVAGAEVSREYLPGSWEPVLWFVPFLLAVAVSAWLGGFGPGAIATVGSTWQVSRFLTRPTYLAVPGVPDAATDAFTIVLFFGFCLLVCILCSANRPLSHVG
jgi:hypothetical protein